MLKYIEETTLEKMYREEGMQEGIQQGMKALILDNLEENVSKEKIIGKLQRRFELSLEQAELYYQKFADTEKAL